ncbi:MAG: DUF3034 family protein [Gluconobacter potus]|uniref:DUF3034 family protein n=3 Tax=Gluconobacter TaxID=441 RepID=A0A149QTY6_9PROT|nr:MULTISPECIES: DUF3034 family protein [Gluconobacter]GEM16368.1 hypothetical protein NBRC3293_0865 [Gluconobacter oxydans NBRC 3293]KXV00634.1 hypothetical protein AD929_09935 [Gluconobacter potus]KXV63313.1 hypothetical protein AD950_13080 [Gluconobacter oxydans]MBF0850031.1 DUF3034 family protein [Gluconobacter sp. R75690]MBF0863862.1 DUF3034 family protein [Gluconobacter sp. R71656]
MHRFPTAAQSFRILTSMTALLSLGTLITGQDAKAATSTTTPQVTLGDDGNSNGQSMFRTLFDGQRALGTSGLSSLEGASGGGIASWATIGGYGSNKSAGMAMHYSYVNLTSYWDQNVGASMGFFDRVEISYTHNFFQTRGTGAKLGIGNGYQFDLDVAGAKVRLFGHVADNTLIPQVAIGGMYKHDSDGKVIHEVGSMHTDGGDAYLAVTKLFPKIGILIDTTVRFTKGNQWGILGFGGDKDNNYHAQFEGSLGYLPSFIPGLVVGVEYRTKPRNQRFTDESNWFDVYTSYFVNKHLNVTLAYVSLGTIATYKDQTGFYFSAQTGF